MIYMVEMELPDRSDIAAWHDWYLAHIAKLLSVPDFEASQRFQSVEPTQAPFLALHQVKGADVFISAAYRAVGGPSATGEWQAKMTNWSRNLLEGLNESPDVASDEWLVVLDEQKDVPTGLVDRVTWLRGVGLDQSVTARGLAVVGPDFDISSLRQMPSVTCYTPLTRKLRHGDI